VNALFGCAIGGAAIAFGVWLRRHPRWGVDWAVAYYRFFAGDNPTSTWGQRLTDPDFWEGWNRSFAWVMMAIGVVFGVSLVLSS
jgi:hypothetical protein